MLRADNIDSLTERMTLSDYICQYKWYGGKTKLRLLCCAERAGGSTRPAQLEAPQCWRRQATSIRSEAIGSILDEQGKGNAIMNELVQRCGASWPDAVQYLDHLTEAERAAILVRSGTGALIIKFWQAWPVLPSQSTSILVWIPFLEVFTPSTATALALYHSWEDEREYLRSLCQTLEDICKNIRELLAGGCPPGVDVSFLDSFLSTGWAPEQPPEDPDLEAEFEAEFDAELASLDDDGGVHGRGDPEPAQRGIKRPRDPDPGDDEPNTRHRPN